MCKISRDQKYSIMHPHVEFVIMEAVRISEYQLCPRLLFGIVACAFVLFPTTFLEIAVTGNKESASHAC